MMAEIRGGYISIDSIIIKASKEILIISSLIYKNQIIIEDKKSNLVLISIYFNNKVEINIIS